MTKHINIDTNVVGEIDDRLQKILADMPKFTAEPIELDKEAIKGRYDLLVNALHSRPLTEDEVKWKHYVEHYMTCDDPNHHHDITYTYYEKEINL